MRELTEAGTAVPTDLAGTYALIAGWVRSFLMREHPDLGRSGDVCPFTGQALRLDTIRIGVCAAASSDFSGVKSTMRHAFGEFASIPCARSMQHFRTIIVGFPNVNDAAGHAALKRVQARLKLYSFVRGLMIGRFHPQSDDPGLWNPQFRPLRPPLPMLAIRHLVENDAPFALRHPLLLPAYLSRFRSAAPRLLRTTGRRPRQA
jgi:Domain of unknown function (DUF6875)